MKHFLKRYMTTVLFSLLLPTLAQASDPPKRTINAKESDWTFLVYMESCEKLLYWGLKNITDMALAAKDSNIKILVQLHVKGDTAWRYEIDQGIICIDDVVKFENNYVESIVSSMKWAVEEHPAEHYGIIFWNHGFGIIDPVYVENNKEGFPWQAESLHDEVLCESGLCPMKGFMFNFEKKDYVTNDMLVAAMEKISNEVLGGKKVDIFGADCCKMAMLEVGYQIKEYADYLVGSQNCELADGWDYKTMFNKISNTSSPVEAAKITVNSYEEYCKTHSTQGLFTLSAFDISISGEIADNLNEICDILQRIIENNPEFKESITKARSRCVTICDAPYYTDLDSFYGEVLKELKKMTETENTKDLTSALDEGRKLIEKAVVANCFGDNINRVRGISIYFPKKRIDESYKTTLFAQETKWLSFLELIFS